MLSIAGMSLLTLALKLTECLTVPARVHDECTLGTGNINVDAVIDNDLMTMYTWQS